MDITGAAGKAKVFPAALSDFKQYFPVLDGAGYEHRGLTDCIRPPQTPQPKGRGKGIKIVLQTVDKLLLR